MSTDKLFKVSSEWASKALINKDKYKQMYSESINDNEGFWHKHGQRIDWIKLYSKIKDIKYSSKEVYIKWYYDGYLNVCANCVDRDAGRDPNKIAIIWESKTSGGVNSYLKYLLQSKVFLDKLSSKLLLRK